jgi:hypothetical protein
MDTALIPYLGMIGLFIVIGSVNYFLKRKERLRKDDQFKKERNNL